MKKDERKRNQTKHASEGMMEVAKSERRRKKTRKQDKRKGTRPTRGPVIES